MTILELVDIVGEEKAKELVEGKGGDRIPVSAQRLDIEKKHIKIRELYNNGVPIKRLSAGFHYSIQWIYKIIRSGLC